MSKTVEWLVEMRGPRQDALAVFRVIADSGHTGDAADPDDFFPEDGVYSLSFDTYSFFALDDMMDAIQEVTTGRQELVVAVFYREECSWEHQKVLFFNGHRIRFKTVTYYRPISEKGEHQ